MGSAKQRLPGRIVSTQSVEPQFTGKGMQFGTHESMRPVTIGVHGLMQQPELSSLIGAPEEQNPRLCRLAREYLVGQSQARRGCVDAGGMFGAMGGHEVVRSMAQARYRPVPPAMPDFLLPERVVAFNFGLEACFLRRNKNWHHPQAEAEVYDSAQTVGMPVSALEAGVVVKLDVVGSPKALPVFRQTGQHVSGVNCVARPRSNQAAVKRDSVEDLDFSATANDQTFDDVHRIQFGLAIGQCGQIPTRWRSGTAYPLTLDQAVPGKDASDGADRRQRRSVLGLELSADGGGTIFPQRRMAFKPSAQMEDTLDDAARRAVGGSRITARPILPIDAIKSLALGSLDPFADHAQCHTEAFGHGTQGGATSCCGNDLATFKCEWIFFTMAACQKPRAVSVRRWCPGGLLRSGSLRSPALRSPSGHYSWPQKCSRLLVT